MKRICDINEFSSKNPYPVATLGVFDGVHLGHQKIIECVLQHTRKNKGESIIVTFDRNPKDFIEKRPPSFITSLDHRLALIEEMGVDYAIVLAFDRQRADMTAEAFIRNMLIERLGIKCIVLGFNCHFGKDRQGNIAFVRRLAHKYNYEVYECTPVLFENQAISSTAIRKSILEGNLRRAEKMLGRPVSVRGTVVGKSGRGRELGYPTANLDLHHEIRPPRGVYGTRVRFAKQEYLALTNIGLRPTFEQEPFVGKDEALEIEVHILDFCETIYGKDLDVEFLFKIRDEIPFETEEKLKLQIEKDKEILLKRIYVAPSCEK
ncbi:MAG: bifunctional riboflavin kinase/FAD synthetase [Candidatus Brocadiaceae bacterium]|nr:bifunctional riboflavin kinase/FAD synthetase [Candidatus Brocadiaceae bacterium]